MAAPAKPSSSVSAVKPRYVSGARVALAGVVVNALLSIIKIAGGILGNTYVLIADGMESLLDIFASMVVWFGLRVASEPPDAEHPYGHGKAETLAAVVVA